MKLHKNQGLKVTISKKGYTLWKLTAIVNMLEEYEVVKENLSSMDEVMKHIPDGQYIDLYLHDGEINMGRYR